MNNIPQTRIPTGGVDQTNLPHVTNPQNWWELVNLRPVNGGLEQTPLLVPIKTLNYSYSGANYEVRMLEHVTLGGVSHILFGTTSYMRLMNTATYNELGQMEYLQQTKMPTDSTATTVAEINTSGSTHFTEEVDITGTLSALDIATGAIGSTPISQQVLLYGNLPSRFVALGDKFTLEILSATTARWQYNSGPYYTITIAKTVVIDPGLNLSLAFMATEGFVIGDIWEWTVVAFPTAATNVSVSTTFYNNDVYVSGYGRRIIRVRDGFATNIGYKPVFGKRSAVFFNHLVVAQYEEGFANSATDIVDPYDVATTPWKLAWSHLNDPDQFFPTDLNEADVYEISSTVSTNRGSLGITGLAQLNEVLVIYLVNAMFYMRYVGLPNVMQITPLASNVGSIFSDGLVVTSEGHFFIGVDNIYFFEGTKPTPMGFGVIKQFFAEVGTAVNNPRFDWTYGRFDEQRSEVIWTYWIPFPGFAGYYRCKQLIYQVDFKRFYFRNMPSDSSSDSNVRAFLPELTSTNRVAKIYGGNGIIMHDHVFGVDPLNTAVKDTLLLNTGGGSFRQDYTVPYAETPDLFYGDLFSVKEHSSFLLDAAYQAGEGVQILHSARKGVGNPLAVTVSPLQKLWTPTLPERILSFPRISGVVFRYGFSGVIANGIYDPISETTCFVPPIGLNITGYADFIYTGKAEK